MAKVSLQHVSRLQAGDKGRLEDFNLEVQDRELLVLAGPEGAGNSAVLRMVAGLEEISAGDILIGGKPINGLAPKDRDVAMIFSGDSLYPDMSAYENMAYGLKLRKLPKGEIKKRIEETAGLLEISGLLDRKPRTLSPEERQRVAFGRAIARQPKVFLFDEPLLQLDPQARSRMRAEISRLHQRLQATMIYAARDQAEAMAIGERIAVMKDGRIEQIDSPSKLYGEPANLFVAGFFGQPPMNFIHGKLRDAGSGALLFKEAQGGVLELALPARPEAAAQAGRDVILGLRPEAVKLLKPAPEARAARGAGRFQSLVDLVEPLGAESNVHLQTGAHALVCRTSAPIAQEDAGHRIQFEIDTAQVHLFDPETGRRLVR